MDSIAIVGKLHNALLEKKKTVATAESCTGGLVSKLLTELPGSSAFFQGGAVAYAYSAKETMLYVSESLLFKFGAVSAEVAEAMATGIQRSLAVDFAVSVTGIAGPDGGTEEKPVGTVYCGIAGKAVKSQIFQLEGTRSEIREESARLALLELLREVTASGA